MQTTKIAKSKEQRCNGDTNEMNDDQDDENTKHSATKCSTKQCNKTPNKMAIS